jgi:hypothetical protein
MHMLLLVDLYLAVFPSPQRPAGLEEGFAESKRCYLFLMNLIKMESISVMKFIRVKIYLIWNVLKAVNNHFVLVFYMILPLCATTIRLHSIYWFYHERIKAFHVKDAEFNPTGKQGTLVDTKVG